MTWMALQPHFDRNRCRTLSLTFNIDLWLWSQWPESGMWHTSSDNAKVCKVSFRYLGWWRNLGLDKVIFGLIWHLTLSSDLDICHRDMKVQCSTKHSGNSKPRKNDKPYLPLLINRASSSGTAIPSKSRTLLFCQYTMSKYTKLMKFIYT